VYDAVVRILGAGYERNILKKQHVAKPVISVGNITLGGTGKTPLVAAIVGYLQGRGIRPAVLMRGYMADKKAAGSTSDEALLLQRLCPGVPVVTGRDRAAQARRALADHAIDCFILDDGFQHWRLHRDLDIVAIDAAQPFGNGHVLPRGIMREPFAALRRADVFVITRADMGTENIDGIRSRLLAVNPYALRVEAAHRPVGLRDVCAESMSMPLTFLHGKKICSMCSIGNPASFHRLLATLGAVCKENFSFIDHHRYTAADIARVADVCRREHIDTVITTAKDAVKLKEYCPQLRGAARLVCLNIAIELTKGKNEFFRRITDLLDR